MAKSDTIEIAELKRLIDHLFEYLMRSGVDRVPVTQNFYWTVFVDDAFNLPDTPAPMMGDVLDDLEDLRGGSRKLPCG